MYASNNSYALREDLPPVTQPLSVTCNSLGRIVLLSVFLCMWFTRICYVYTWKGVRAR